MINLNIEQFIKDSITNRQESLFAEDLKKYANPISKEVTGKSILVIGGAGTIGSSFIKAILKYNPSKLVVVDYNENGLTELTRDLRSSTTIKVPEIYITYPFDFSSNVFFKLLKNTHFDIVACFAAHKHVRSEKDHLAIEAMINNNVFNTKKLLDALVVKQPSHFFCVSTDKAANPVNVMGASKKLMEKVLLAYSEKLKITTARFANVAFSNGSLLAGFNERIQKQQPISSPLDVKRYFVSPEESGQLCMLTCLLGKSGDIFFPKLGQKNMMTFSKIAESYLSKLGYQLDYSETESEAKQKTFLINNKVYPVYFFKSETSGEKMYEEFYTEDDELNLDSFNALGVIKKPNTVNPVSIEEVEGICNNLISLFESDNLNKSQIIDVMSEYLPDFNHIETGKNLDQKM